MNNLEREHWHGDASVRDWQVGVQDLVGQPNTVLVIGIGLHYNLNFDAIKDRVSRLELNVREQRDIEDRRD